MRVSEQYVKIVKPFLQGTIYKSLTIFLPPIYYDRGIYNIPVGCAHNPVRGIIVILVQYITRTGLRHNINR